MIDFLEKYFKLILFGSLLFLSLSYAIEVLNGGHAWKTGDWLINYSGGFIRRGLLGDLFISIFSTHEALLGFLFLFKAAIYFLLFHTVVKIYQSYPRHSSYIFLILSPAYLLFPFYDMVGAFRKEILILLIFAIYCLFYIKKSITNLKLFSLIVLYVLIALNHELIVFTLPFFLYIIYLSFKDDQISKAAFLSVSVALSFFSILFLFISNQYHADRAIVEAICNELILIGFGNHICSGSIDWLSDSPEIARLKVVQSLSGFPYMSVLGFLLAIFPALLIWLRTRAHLYLILISFASFTPLYYFALDWGRWIHIYSFFVLTIVLVENNSPHFEFSPILIFLGLTYLTTWSLPHCCVGSLNLGLLGVLQNYPQKIIHHISLLF